MRCPIPRRFRRHNRRRPRSNYEKLVEGWLKEAKIKYKREAPIGWCHADFLLLPKTIVEINGCYWHGCYKCFPEPTVDQKKQKLKDYYRYKFFHGQGYRVIIIRGHDLDESPEEMKAKLLALGVKRDS